MKLIDILKGGLIAGAIGLSSLTGCTPSANITVREQNTILNHKYSGSYNIYDTQGNVIEAACDPDGDNILNRIYRYKYDAQGNRTEEIIDKYDAQGNRTERTIDEGADFSIEKVIKYTIQE